MDIGRTAKPLAEHCAVLLAFTLIALAFTWPLAADFAGRVAGDFDTYWFLWDLWHFNWSLSHGLNPMQAPMIFYPTGTSLYSSTTSPLLAIASIPLQGAFGPFAAYNILYLLSYVLSAYTMYLLAFHITKDRKAAFLAGLIFAFCPYHSGHALRHLNLMSTQFLPLLVLALLRLKEEPASKARIVVFAGALALVFLCSEIYFAMSVIFIALFFLVEKFALKKSVKPGVLGAAAGLLAALLLLSPLLLPMVLDALTVKYESAFNLGVVAAYSADLVDFMRPPLQNPLLGGLAHAMSSLTPQIPEKLWMAERSLYVGLGVLFLLACGIFRARPDMAGAWPWLLACFFLLSLGPFLMAAGNLLPILLPYTLLVPVGQFLRVPARFGVFFFLCAAVVAAIAYRELWAGAKGRGPKILLALLPLLILAEYWAPPQDFILADASPFYGTLAAMPGDFAVLDIPQEGGFSAYGSWLMYLQAVHHKPIVGGALSRTPLYALNYTSSEPCVHGLTTLNASACGGRALDPGIRYVIYHKYYVPPGYAPDGFNSGAFEGRLAGLFGAPVFSDADISVYCAHRGECDPVE